MRGRDEGGVRAERGARQAAVREGVRGRRRGSQPFQAALGQVPLELVLKLLRGALDQLPPLADVKDLETMTSALPLEEFHDSRGEENEPETADAQGIAVESVQDDEAVDSE